ncbi:C-type lectin domain family 18 member B-like [Mytilus edulis]|uniref:C-type lectin domain family 18 member B-like n=1 Tax=Mytilus edulis TaxID=6550 RepID=UPI0039F06C99
MSNCWYMIMFALSVYHVSNAGSRLNRRCKVSNGRCGKNTDLTCSNMFGPGWTEKGKCCGKRSCCVFQCEDLQIDNGKAIINGIGVGSTATLSCESGYRLLGKPVLTCSQNGWSDYIPICFACPETVVTFDGSTYIFRCGKYNWYTAENYCETQGGNLTTIETREENQFLKYVVTLIKTTGEASPNHWWIGLTDIKTENSFEWISGHPLSHTDWYQGQPDNKDRIRLTTNVDCVSLNPRTSFQWFDSNCVTAAVCQALCEI